MAHEFWCISTDLCEVFQIVKSVEIFLFYKNILKTKSKKNLKKIGYVFFGRYFHIKNYRENLRHHCEILIEQLRNAPQWNGEKIEKWVKKFQLITDIFHFLFTIYNKNLIKTFIIFQFNNWNFVIISINNWRLPCNNSIGSWRRLLSLFSSDEMIGNLSDN